MLLLTLVLMLLLGINTPHTSVSVYSAAVQRFLSLSHLLPGGPWQRHSDSRAHLGVCLRLNLSLRLAGPPPDHWQLSAGEACLAVSSLSQWSGTQSLRMHLGIALCRGRIRRAALLCAGLCCTVLHCAAPIALCCTVLYGIQYEFSCAASDTGVPLLEAGANGCVEHPDLMRLRTSTTGLGFRWHHWQHY